MKNNLIYLIIVGISFYIFSCNSKAESEESPNSESNIDTLKSMKKIFQEFDIYTPNGKIGKDKFGLILKPFAQFITPLETSSFFDYRNSIHKNYNKLNFGEPVDSISIKDFLAICSINTDGGVIFSMKKKGQKLSMQPLGIKKYNGRIEVDSGSSISVNDTLEYRKYGRQAIKDNKEPYNDFKNRPFIYFDKQSTSKVLILMQTTYGKEQKLYFYYGYSRKSNNDSYHPSLLFSKYNNLDNPNRSNPPSDQYAFANKGGTCCPPDN